MLDPMVPERRPILRLLMPDENSYGEAGLSQRVMLNAAGRRRWNDETANARITLPMAPFFTTEYLLGTSPRANSRECRQSVSADSSRKRGNSRNGANFKRGAILLLFPKRPSRIWNVIFYGDLGSGVLTAIEL